MGRNYIIRIVLAGLSVLALLALLIILLTKPSVPEQEISLTKLPFSPSVTTVSYANSGDSLLFSNGRFLASYNLEANTVKQLSNTESLPRITRILPSENNRYVAFQTAEQTDNKTLSTLLGEGGLIDMPAWWLLDTNTQTIRVVGQNIDAVEWDSNNLLVSENAAIVSIDPVSNSRRAIYADDSFTSFHKQGKNLYIQHSDNTVRALNTETRQEREVASDAEIVTFGNTDCFIVSTFDETNGHSKLSLHNCNSSTKQITEAIEGYVGFTENSGSEIIFEDDKGITLTDTDLDSVKHLIPVTDDGSDVSVDSAFSSTQIIFRGEETFYITGTDAKPKTIEEDETFVESGISFRLTTDQFITLEKTSEWSDESRVVAQSILRKKGYDLNLFQAYFYGY